MSLHILHQRTPRTGDVERRYRYAATTDLERDQASWRVLLEELDADMDDGNGQWSFPDQTRAYICWHLDMIAEELASRRADAILHGEGFAR